MKYLITYQNITKILKDISNIPNISLNISLVVIGDYS